MHMFVGSLHRYLLLLLLPALACMPQNTYRPPALPADEVATLQTYRDLSLARSLSVLGIDGMNIVPGSARQHVPQPDGTYHYEIAVMPGAHDFLIRDWTRTLLPKDRMAHAVIRASLEPGHHYLLRNAESDGGAALHLWIEDAATEAIAGAVTLQVED